MLQARKAEIESIQAQVTQLPAVERVLYQISANGTINAIDYHVVYWDGGSDAYNYCNLEERAPQYAGTCIEAISYSRTTVEDPPYACGAFSTSGGVNLTGDECLLQVDRQLDCKACCECYVIDDLGYVTRGCDGGSMCAPCLLCMLITLLIALLWNNIRSSYVVHVYAQDYG